MTKWEYGIRNTDSLPTTALLSMWGDERWELVTVVPYLAQPKGIPAYRLIFKRPAANDDEQVAITQQGLEALNG